MTYIEEPSAAAGEVRRLAGSGELGARFRDGTGDERRLLRAGAAEIAGPLVYERVTRPVERKRRHHRCATAVQRMEPDCLDRFHDDVDAVLDDLFQYASVPIENLEGWLTARLLRATVDGYRRRRGARGAPQRPRVPGWLAAALGHDAWLTDLAKAILEWAGTDATSGLSLWPLTAWAERRAGRTGDHTVTEKVVAEEIEVVLTAMRRKPAWYDRNVEQPLGRKPAPVWYPPRVPSGAHAESAPLALVQPYERDDTLMRELAGLAIEVMGARIDRGEDPAVVVPEVLRTVFGSLPASYDLDRPPATDGAGADQVVALIDDPDRFDGIVAAVRELLRAWGRDEHTS